MDKDDACQHSLEAILARPDVAAHIRQLVSEATTGNSVHMVDYFFAQGVQEAVSRITAGITTTVNGIVRDMTPDVLRDVAVLDLSVRTYNCLKRMGYDTIYDVLCLSDEQLRQISGFGQTSMEDLHLRLSEAGYAHDCGDD